MCCVALDGVVAVGAVVALAKVYRCSYLFTLLIVLLVSCQKRGSRIN